MRLRISKEFRKLISEKKPASQGLRERRGLGKISVRFFKKLQPSQGSQITKQRTANNYDIQSVLNQDFDITSRRGGQPKQPRQI